MKINEHGADIFTESLEEGISHNDIIDFSSNINPLGIDSRVLAALKLELENIDRYPDINSRELISEIGRNENIDEEMIFVSNGAAEAIYRIALLLNPKNALLLAPTFSEYEASLNLLKTKIDYYNLEEENDYKLQEDYIHRIKNYDAIYLCNPNNPTGQAINKEFIKEILEEAKLNEVMVVIDECFIDFIRRSNDYSAREYLYLYNNLIIINAFTKTYALPGIRLGYAMSSNKKIIKKLKEYGPPWNVSNLAQRSGIESLRLKDYLKSSSEYIYKERKYLSDNLKKIGFTVFGGKANFILFKSDIKNLKGKLLKHNLLIRDCSNYRNLTEEHFRVAVKSSKDNQYLISVIKEIIESEDN